MRKRNVHLKIIINFLLITFILAVESNAQIEYKRKLDDYNQRNTFPTGQVDDYGLSLDNLYTYYKGLITSEQNLEKLIREVENDLVKNQENLEGARDSTSKDKYINLGKQLILKKDSLTAEIKKIDPIGCKNTLSKSYQKIIDYYTSIEDPKYKDWQKKFDAFKQLK